MRKRISDEELTEGINLEKQIRQVEMEIWESFQELRTGEKNSETITKTRRIIRKWSVLLKDIAEVLEDKEAKQ